MIMTLPCMVYFLQLYMWLYVPVLKVPSILAEKVPSKAVNIKQ
jgi:hypothetical protein